MSCYQLCLKILNPTDVTCVISYDTDRLIPSCGEWFEIIAYKHVAFKLINYALAYSLETLRSFSKVRKQFSSASKLIIFLAYDIFYDIIWNLPPWKNCPGGFSLLTPICIIPQSRPKRQ